MAIDDKTFSSDFDVNHERGGTPDKPGYRGVGVPPVSVVPFGFLEMDDPDHAHIRRALTPWLGPEAAANWVPVIEDLTNAFIDEVIERGECDFIDDIASPIPAVLTMMMLGTPLGKWKEWAEANHLQQSSFPGTPQKQRSEELMNDLVADLAGIIAERRANPPEGEPKDLLGVMCQNEIGGRLLTEQEILLHAVLIVGGGVDTTTSVMGAAIKWLAQHPGERTRLAEDPDLTKTAIEEFLRVFPPVTGLARTAKCPVQVGDQKVDEGDRVLLMYAAANYDPQIFDEPQEVQLDRWPNRHTTFGLGGHRCIGLHVARAVFTVVLRQVLERLPDYTIDHENAQIYPDVGLNQGWISLPMKFTPGSKVGSEFKPSDAAPTASAVNAAAGMSDAIANAADEVVH
ncbi:cytochrome P450 [Rhodococcus sp. ACS1]|uniref:cytochrome P450 n=1 Tax=Rhodococcus sp. ACS1 TaxID=2028570 RepID=UPI0015C8F309|nr:cytochrome P450 [Rhodococcus sp. ACS1]